MKSATIRPIPRSERSASARIGSGWEPNGSVSIRQRWVGASSADDALPEAPSIARPPTITSGGPSPISS